MLAKALLKSRPIELFALALLLAVGLLCIYSPTHLPRWGANHAPQIMLTYFGLGIVFFMMNKPRFTFTSFACCAMLCLFLKQSTHGQQLRYAVPTDQPELKIAHFNANNFDVDLDNMLELFRDMDLDLLSIQGLDPMLEMVLQEELSKEYPHQYSVPSLSYYGMAVLSKHAFTAKQFNYGEMPNIFGELHVQGFGKAYFVSTHTVPALTSTDYMRNQEHLEIVSHQCNALDAPLIALGDYHLVPWSPEIRTFRTNTALNDSRIGFAPSFIDGKVNFLDVPQDHIFYSDHFKCTSFSILSTSESPHMGIVGTFEFLQEGESLTDASLYHQ
ncbi:MAG: endonuclease/exonuclease/phosphatase family protein [Bacteroidota bacterium]